MTGGHSADGRSGGRRPSDLDRLCRLNIDQGTWAGGLADSLARLLPGRDWRSACLSRGAQLQPVVVVVRTHRSPPPRWLFRAATKLLGGSRDIPVKLWVAPPTKMDESELIKEGHYANFGAAGARTEMPGCSLCMGNQAQVREGATVVSTSTRNFPNRLGKNTNVYLASAELAAIASKLGHIPTVAQYHEAMGIVNKDGAAIYQYLNFNQIEEYVEKAKGVTA